MTVAENMLHKITQALDPVHVDLVNESHMHAGPATDSHFKLVVVSNIFEGKSRVRRHQTLYQLLAEDLAGPVHALALHAYTPAEWMEKTGQSPQSPPCLGGSKKEAGTQVKL